MTYSDKYLKYKNKYLNLKKIIQNNKTLNMTGGGLQEERTPSIIYSETNKDNKTLVFIKAEWCGYCTEFKKIWEKLPLEIKNINFKVLDSELNKKEIKNYNIKGFPSIFLEIGDKKIEYNGSRNIKAIKEFVSIN